MTARLVVLACAATALCATAAQADSIKMSASLTGQSEVPPVQTPAKGSATVTVDSATRAMQWDVQVQDLSGPVNAAHFHCPAPVGQNAPVAIPISGAGGVSPLKGSAIASAEHMENLLAGRCYINVHTPQHPTGEIRGQVVRQ